MSTIFAWHIWFGTSTILPCQFVVAVITTTKIATPF
jgi:hypothetical protein